MRFYGKYRPIMYGIMLLIILIIIFKYNYFQFIQKYTIKSVVTTNPNDTEYWFPLKITKQNDKSNEHTVKLILLWTGFFGASDYIPPLEKLHCPIKNCVITSNHSLLNQSDALIFHYWDTSPKDVPTIRRNFQKWIFLNHEAPPTTHNILKPLEGLFNWTITYRLDSDVVLTPRVEKVKSSLRKIVPDLAHTKTHMVAWFVTKCKTTGKREDYVKELQKSISVDVYGKCGTKVCLPKMSEKCYKKVASEYRYYLAFENNLCKDYVTEKLFNVLNTDMIPVVFGGVDYSQVAPPNSYIDALSFRSPKELAHFLLILANDTKRYNSYFEWKSLYGIREEHYACELCKKLNEPMKYSWKRDIYKWWFDDAKCQIWTPNKLIYWPQS